MQRLGLLLLFIILPISFLFSQEEPKTQEFFDLLISSRLFEAFEYYEKYEVEINAEDSLAGKTLYNAFKNAALNEYDNSIAYFNEIFNNISGDSKYSIIEALWNFSFNSQKYENAAYLSAMLVEMLENNESPVADEYKENQIKVHTQFRDLCSLLQQEEEMKICFSDSSTVIIDFNHSYDIPIIHVQVNQYQTRALFDTGVSPPLLMPRQIADSIGVRIVCDEIIIPFNSIPTSIAYGILDSLRIGSVTVYNLLTLIPDIDKPDQETSIDANAFNHGDMEIMIGLPFMKQMGMISFNFENERLKLSAKDESNKDNYNMLMYGNSLYLRAAINGVPHTGFIDTGSSWDEVRLNNSLYDRYKNDFGTIKSNYLDTATLITHQEVLSLGIIENLKWGLLNQSPIVDISEESRVRLDTENEPDQYDAFYGFKFMQRFKKVIFDFNKMEFRYEYDPLRDMP